eukprot:snap_masked-scaffold_17-processed-gene-5.13-mRNA-1 protein AED:1.00 eAED:1.00 QI:0/0/0/0/1/1/2/0/310
MCKELTPASVCGVGTCETYSNASICSCSSGWEHSTEFGQDSSQAVCLTNTTILILLVSLNLVIVLISFYKHLTFITRISQLKRLIPYIVILLSSSVVSASFFHMYKTSTTLNILNHIHILLPICLIFLAFNFAHSIFNYKYIRAQQHTLSLKSPFFSFQLKLILHSTSVFISLGIGISGFTIQFFLASSFLLRDVRRLEVVSKSSLYKKVYSNIYWTRFFSTMNSVLLSSWTISSFFSPFVLTLFPYLITILVSCSLSVSLFNLKKHKSNRRTEKSKASPSRQLNPQHLGTWFSTDSLLIRSMPVKKHSI